MNRVGRRDARALERRLRGGSVPGPSATFCDWRPDGEAAEALGRRGSSPCRRTGSSADY